MAKSAYRDQLPTRPDALGKLLLPAGLPLNSMPVAFHKKLLSPLLRRQLFEVGVKDEELPRQSSQLRDQIRLHLDQR